MTDARQSSQRRYVYLDALRILAAFLVIVNHTNSQVFKSDAPGETEWVLSVLWYYVSKAAVPLFVMASGACLLGRTDGYRKTGWRILRVVIVLLAFSYMVYLYDAWVNYGLWPRAVDFGEFFSLVWQMKLLDDYWYVSLYVGLMLMLPLMQRLATAMKPRDMLYLIGVSFGLNALWPLVVHYAPGLALPPYFSAPMFGVFIGLFFAGYWLNEHFTISRKTVPICCLALALSLAASTLLTYRESFVAEKYWFMDAREAPSILTIVAALAVMALMKATHARELSGKRQACPRELGGCMFGVYMWQGFLIELTKSRLYPALCGLMPKLCAALVWEVAVFAAATALTWLLRRIPMIRKLL